MIPDATNGLPDDIAHNQEPPELPIDRRRKVTDPTLFDLPVQEAPAKPGTSKGEYADWDALIKRIIATRIPVKLEQSKSGGSKFSVPSLSPDENEDRKSTRLNSSH